MLQTPYETNGQQVSPTINIHQWLINRAAGATQGPDGQPDIQFAASGQARGLKPYWPSQFANVAPRLAFAYSPDNKTSIRGGFGIYYDHFGQGIVNSFDQLRLVWPTTALTNPAGTLFRRITLRASPASIICLRWNLRAAEPSFNIRTPRLRTRIHRLRHHLGHRRPPEDALFGGRRLLRAARVAGRIHSRSRLPWPLRPPALQQLDLAEPLDLVDPKSGMDYFRAGTLLSQDVDRNNGYADPNGAASASVETDSLLREHVSLSRGGGMSATQNIYSNEWAFRAWQ